MRRFVAVLGLVVSPLVGYSPPANAVGYGACVVTGTINFSAETPSTGTWVIRTAALDCQGLFAARRRVIGRGPLQGSGTFSTIAPAGGSCFQPIGDGKLDYRIPTTGGEIHVTEDVSFTAAGAGIISTPSLKGAIELPPPYAGECLTTPAGKSTLIAEVVIVRYPREPPSPDRLPLP